MARKRVTVFERNFRAAFERTALPERLELALRVLDKRDDVANIGEEFGMHRFEYRNRDDMRLALLDRLLGTHGVEELGDGKWRYLNVGESYAPTVIWYRSSGRFYIRCYADIVEAYRLK